MNATKKFRWLALIAVISILFTACQPQTVVQKVVETVIVEKPGAPQVVEKVVEKMVTPTPEPTTPPPSKASPGQRAEVIRLALLSDIDGLNPWYYNDITGSSYWNGVILQFGYPVLYVVSDQRWDWVPWVADGLAGPAVKEGDFWVGTAKIKKGLTWSDGTPVTAADVAFTSDVVMSFALTGNWVTWYNPAVLDHVEAADDLTVKYYFKVLPGLAIWQYGALIGPFVQKAYWESKVKDVLAQVKALDPKAADYSEKLAPLAKALEAIENDGEPMFGPIKFKKWEPGAFVESEANDEWAFIGTNEQQFTNGAYKETNTGEFNKGRSYEFKAYGEPTGDKALDMTWGPYFQSWIFSVYSQDAAYLALQNGEVDAVLNPSGISQGVADQLKSNPNVQIVKNAQNGFRYIEFNQARAFFKDKQGMALRQAIACQIDLDFLAGNVLQKQVEPVYTLVPSGLTYWHNKDVPIYCKDMTPDQRLAESVRLMKEAGFSWN